MPSPTEVKLVPNKTRERLNDRQVVDYEAHREKMVKWLLNMGKDPDRVEGYALETVKGRIYRIDRFYRFVWDNLEDGYTKRVTTSTRTSSWNTSRTATTLTRTSPST